MKIINFGSLNIDKVYAVTHFSRAEETLAALSLKTLCGGKGLNQSIALKKAGLDVRHAGCVGADGGILVKMLENNGVDVSLISVSESVETGHAIIQVDPSGQNSILLFGGANRAVTREMIDRVLSGFAPGDVLVMQNEISEANYLLKKAADIQMRIFLNASPIDDELLSWNFSAVDTMLINEIEGKAITGHTEPGEIGRKLIRIYPKLKVLLTLGGDGSFYFDAEKTLFQEAFPTAVEDTTGAGDTFTGFYIEEILRTGDPVSAMRTAAMAASIAVSRSGAGCAIPSMGEVKERLK